MFKHQLSQITLAHYRVGHVQAGKLALLWMMREGAVVNDPFIQRTVILKLNRTHRMGDPFDCVLNRVCEIVQRINAPCIPLAVMMGADNPVNSRVTHIHIGGCHVDFCPQRFGTIREFPGPHVFKQL